MVDLYDVHNRQFIVPPTAEEMDASLRKSMGMTDDATTGNVKAIRDILERRFPPSDIKQRKGGRGKMLDYLDGVTVIRRLMQATDTWEWRITETRVLDTYRNEYTDRQTGAVTGGKNDPTPTLMVVGELTIPGLGTRAGIGVTTIEPGAGEDNLKGASTDALKKAATLFGVGLDLYDDTPAQPSAAPELPASHKPDAYELPPERPSRLSHVQSPQTAQNAPQRGTQAPTGNRQFPPAQPGTGGPATDGQKRALWAISGQSKEQIDQWAAEYGESNANLTKGTASVLIDTHGGR